MQISLYQLKLFLLALFFISSVALAWRWRISVRVCESAYYNNMATLVHSLSHQFLTRPLAFGYISYLAFFSCCSSLCWPLMLWTMLTTSMLAMSCFFFFAVRGRFADCCRFFLFFSFLAASSGSSLTAPSSVYRKNALYFSGGW